MDAVVPDYARFVRPQTVFLSIAAGKTIADFAEPLGARAATIRAMPHTPAAVGHRVTVLCANRNVTPAQMALKIGRASCRERVCQHVSISVGPVSIQTTTQT